MGRHRSGSPTRPRRSGTEIDRRAAADPGTAAPHHSVLGGISLGPVAWLGLARWLLFGAISFVALGVAIAYLAGPGAAPAVANLAYVGMAFASGMLVRLDQMPDPLRAIAPGLPTYHYAQLAWGAIGAGDESVLVARAWLLASTIGLFGLAAWAYRREATRNIRLGLELTNVDIQAPGTAQDRGRLSAMARRRGG